jgi:hypothetical protein
VSSQGEGGDSARFLRGLESVPVLPVVAQSCSIQANHRSAMASTSALLMSVHVAAKCAGGFDSHWSPVQPTDRSMPAAGGPAASLET